MTPPEPGARGAPDHGQAMVEYLVGLAILTAIISVPFDGHASMAEYFMATVKDAYYGFFNALSVPL